MMYCLISRDRQDQHPLTGGSAGRPRRGRGYTSTPMMSACGPGACSPDFHQHSFHQRVFMFGLRKISTFVGFKFRPAPSFTLQGGGCSCPTPPSALRSPGALSHRVLRALLQTEELQEPLCLEQTLR